MQITTIALMDTVAADDLGYIDRQGLYWLCLHNPMMYYFGENTCQDEFSSEAIDGHKVVVQLCIRTSDCWDNYTKCLNFCEPKYPKPLKRGPMYWNDLVAYYGLSIAFISYPHEVGSNYEERVLAATMESLSV